MTLAEYIKTNITDKEELAVKTTIVKYKKGDTVIKTGEQETAIHFVVSGILESVVMAKKEEKILDFFFPNDLFSKIVSNESGGGSISSLNCLTDCVIEKIPLKEFVESLKTSPLSSRLSIHIYHTRLNVRVRKEISTLTKNAQERYAELIKERPEVIKQISTSKVAKYLGIHPNSLSRIKKSLLT